MADFNPSEFKRALAEAREQQHDQSKQVHTLSSQRKPSPPNREIAQLLRRFAKQADLDLESVDRMLAQQQDEMRRSFQAEKVEAAAGATARRAAFNRAIAEREQAIAYLANHPQEAAVGLSSLLSLTKPFLIWEWPLDISLVSSHIEPLNSSARIKLDVPVYSFDNDSGVDQREFSFYFLWQNPSDFIAVVNCFSVLSLNGACELYANSGITSGDTTSLSIDAYLFPIAYWLPLAPGGNIRQLRMGGDPQQHQSVLSELTATGGAIFGDAGTASKLFPSISVGMSYGTYGGLSIPARATALFEVNLTMSYSWSGNTLPDEIIADFADEGHHYNVECPIVVLQFLTAPPMAA
ncbi:hypothetical protein GMLC_19200 [Geomonas limicola]|uniref:Uncharacterized protein n=1 Tax=Geomonas limicola TaxID=2740186 RepID=A0A6V8N786_9BACT|nr:hypothetical protein [Geomonas limicola]GFO68341.1 hypothetical protein GMLC_19200 [Geomonas limicola]